MISLEEMFVGADYFAAKTPTALQIAICRIIDGKPLGELLTHPDVLFAVGDYSACNGIRPKRVDCLSGARTGKSFTAGAVVTHNSQTCDVSRLSPGEIPRASVISIDKDKAQTVLDHCMGNIRRSSILSKKIVGRPLKWNFFIKHPAGRNIEIAVVAGINSGGAVVSRWCAGLVLDEAARMFGDEDATSLNFDSILRNTEGRLLDGAQIVCISTPGPPRGPMYKAVKEKWRKPTPEHVVIKAPAWMMNPSWWTPERIAGMSPDARRTDVEAEFAEQSDSLFAHYSIQRCIDGPKPVAYGRRRLTYVAALDPGTRGPFWTLVVLGADEAERSAEHWNVVAFREWVAPSQGSPLMTLDTLVEVKAVLDAFELDGAWTDQWTSQRTQDIATKLGMGLWTKELKMEQRVESMESLRVLIEASRLTLPNDPDFRDDLLNVVRRLVAAGPVIEIPNSPKGRTANYARVLALACMEACAVIPKVKDPKSEEALLIERLENEARRRPFDRATSRLPYWRR